LSASDLEGLLPARIVSSINFDGPVPPEPARPIDTGCWLWTRGTFPAGYGSAWLGGGSRLVHQVVFEAVKGERSDRELFLDHVCRVRRCCRPDHLELVTPEGNQISAQRPTCRKGHLLDVRNTGAVVGKKNQRTCRKCAAQRQRDYRARKAAAK